MFEDRKLAGILALDRALIVLTTMLMLLVPAYSQQDMDPTWYDPWPAANKAIVQHPQQERRTADANRAKTHSKARARLSDTELPRQASRDLKRPKELAARK